MSNDVNDLVNTWCRDGYPELLFIVPGHLQYVMGVTSDNFDLSRLDWRERGYLQVLATRLLERLGEQP